jgi:hypothetical protein
VCKVNVIIFQSSVSEGYFCSFKVLSDTGYFSLKLYHWLYDLIFNKLTLETTWSGGKFF